MYSTIIPKNIKITWLTYTVEINPETDKILEIKGLFGEIDHNEQIIRVKSTLKDDHKQVVFWHEVCHAIVYVTGHNLENEEGFVEIFSSSLSQVLTQNKLIDYGK